LGILSSPIVPNAANRILNQLNIPEDERNIAALQAGMIQPGIELPKPEGVFPRIAV
jgi:methionyl-tRNA synthetase